jgi:pimeloyl-ACP methyl ester carboxylesterase
MGGYLGFWQRQHELRKAFDRQPSAEVLRELDPQGCYLLVGPVALANAYSRPILAVAVSDTFGRREIVATRVLQVPVQYYQAFLPEGHYRLCFFADLNGNGSFDPDEMVGDTADRLVAVSQADVTDGLTVSGPRVTLDVTRPATADLAIKVTVREQDYLYPSLDDPFFDPEYGTLGLYDPKAFMAHAQRNIFGLEEFDPGKTTVVFVHGIQGTPRDFRYLVAGLDRSKYQPWFYFYPSGMPLQKLGSLLAKTLTLGAASGRFPLTRVIVVAHSMGGLVALSALNQLCSQGAPPYLQGYLSIDSPYGGVESAAAGLEKAPALVPCWHDIAPGSPFLERLYQGPATDAIPFHLFFGYTTGDSSDGTIPLQSQLEPRVQFTALRTYGFNATHVGILNDEAVRQRFCGALAAIGGDRRREPAARRAGQQTSE